jgi:hypothetical protein
MPSGCSDSPAKLWTIHFGHHPVRDHQPPILAFDALQGCSARSYQMGLMAKMGENSRKRQPECFLIIDDKYAHGLLLPNEIALD